MNLQKAALITILSSFWIFPACEETPPKEEDTPLEHKTEAIIHKIGHNDLEILVIDGCEYIVFKETEGSNLSYGYMAHKGNCKNPIHIYKAIPTGRDSTINADTLSGTTK